MGQELFGAIVELENKTTVKSTMILRRLNILAHYLWF